MTDAPGRPGGPEAGGNVAPEAHASLRGAMLSGAFWMVATRWVMRFSGLLSTVILARLLVPEDFGLVAMSMVVLGFTEAWFAFGVDMALIHDQKAGRDEFDSAWTLRLLQYLVVALLMVVASPWAAELFDEPRLPEVMWATALGVFLLGFTNIGVVAFRRDLNFRAEFVFTILPKLISLVVTIALAWWLRSYWALVLGTLTFNIATVVASYRMNAYRPRWSLVAFRKLWSFSQWMLLTNVAWYLETRGDEAVIGTLGGTADLGKYSVASEISRLPSTEVASPLMRALFPVAAKMQGQPERLRTAMVKVITTLNGLTLPAGIGLALVAPELVRVMLGESWMGAVPFLQVLGIFGAARSCYGPVGSILVAMGKVREIALITWMHFFVFVGLALWIATDDGLGYGLIGVAWAKFYSALFAAGLNFTLLVALSRVTVLDVLGSFTRPGLATAVMAAAVMTAQSALQGASPAAILVVDLLVGTVSYAVAALVFWQLAGRPDGLEELVLHKLGLITPSGSS